MLRSGVLVVAYRLLIVIRGSFLAAEYRVEVLGYSTGKGDSSGGIIIDLDLLSRKGRRHTCIIVVLAPPKQKRS